VHAEAVLVLYLGRLVRPLLPSSPSIVSVSSLLLS